MTGPTIILESELEKVVEESKNGKATSADEIPAEIMKVNTKDLTELINALYDSGSRRLAPVNIYNAT